MTREKLALSMKYSLVGKTLNCLVRPEPGVAMGQIKKSHIGPIKAFIL